MSKKVQGLIAINIAAILFGSAALYGKLDVSPVWIVAMRAFFASLTLVIIVLLRAQFAMPPLRIFWSIIFSSMILCGHWLTFFISVKLAGIAIATLTFAAFPLFTICLEALIEKKFPHWIKIVSAAMIILAVKLLVDVELSDRWAIIGTLSGLSSAFGFAVFGIISKDLARKLPQAMLSLLQNTIVFMTLAPFLALATPAPIGLMTWTCLLMLGVLTTALMHQLYLFALSRLSAATCSGFVALEPIYAVLFASWFFHEPITSTVAISCSLILTASLSLLLSES